LLSRRAKAPGSSTYLYARFTNFCARNPLRLRHQNAGGESIQGEEKIMRNIPAKVVPAKTVSPTVTIRVGGSLCQGHLSYLDQLAASAIDCALWPLLDLANLNELDRTALMYLLGGEGRDFGIVACPNFVREWMDHEKGRIAA
jgi:hypothetical protein